MLCAKLATRRDGFKFPCGQCANCRINKRRDWQARLLLEAASNEYSAFVTTTFRDVGTPHVLRRSDVRFFIGNLSEVQPLRYFAAAEYGSKLGRAHYHYHIFSARPFLDSDFSRCWPFGSVHIGNTEPSSLDYTLGYLLKNAKVIKWPIEVRYPEFRSFSKGIGKLALPHLLIDGHELPREFKVFGRKWPIGRYLRDRAKKMGFEVTDRQEVTLERVEAQAMRSMLRDPSLTPEEIADLYDTMMRRRKEKSELLQKRAIRAAYLQMHGHVKKGNPNETF